MANCRVPINRLLPPWRPAAMALAACLGAALAPAQLAAQPRVEILHTADDGSLQPGLPPDVLIGEPFDFVVRVSPAAVIGFGPFVELYLDLQGKDCNAPAPPPTIPLQLNCDGVSFLSAAAQFTTTVETIAPCSTTPAGVPFAFPAAGAACVKPTRCPGTSDGRPMCFFGSGGPPTCAAENTAGYQKVVLPLPFGSFVPTQPQVLVTVTAMVDAFADPGFPLTIKARGGFQYGAAAGGPPIVDATCPMLSATTNPAVVRMHKRYLGPEEETATGPNNPVGYQLTVDVANHQTIAGLEVKDCLPGSLVYLASAPQATATTPCVTWDLGTVTGGATHPDTTLTLTAYVPLDDAGTGQPVLGESCKTAIDNRVMASGQWTPLDPRERGPEAVAAQADHPITAKCIALQKTVQDVDDTGARGPTPGDSLSYALKFEISDYKTFDAIAIDDYLADGLVFAGTAAVTVFDKFLGKSGPITPVQSVEPGVFTCADGTRLFQPTHLHFDVSAALAAMDPAGRHARGIVTGGQAGLPTGGQAAGFVFFGAKIADTYSRQHVQPPNVKKDDTLSNCAVIGGTLLQNTDAPAVPPPTPIGTGDDDSKADVTIVTGILHKSIFAIDGVSPLAPLVSPGDDVTFRVTLPIPSTDTTALSFEDFLPLPVFSVSAFPPATSLVPCAAGPSSPLLYTALALDPLCGFLHGEPSLAPLVPSNSLRFVYPSPLSDPSNTLRAADLFFTVQAGAEPYADNLKLTNHVLTSEQNSFGVQFDQTEVADFVLGEPALRIRKGVVAVSRSQVTLTPQPPAPAGVAFHAPDSHQAPPFTGIVNSTNVGKALNSDAANVGGGDRLRFVIAIENLGHSARGAFHVSLRDQLPACLQQQPELPPGGDGQRPSCVRLPSNLQVVRGDGTPLECVGPCSISELLAAGITLADPSSTSGALAPFDPTSGRNIAILTFDASVRCNVAATGCCTNTARLLEYRGTPAGPNHTLFNFSTPFPDVTPTPPSPFVDDARICIAPKAAKSIAATSEPATGTSTSLAIGEVVRYRLQLALPVGVYPSLVLTDILPAGLVWMPGTPGTPGSCTFSKDPQVVLGAGFPIFQVTQFSPSLRVDLGSVVNVPTFHDGALLTIECNALVLNAKPVNRSGDEKDNHFTATLTPPGAAAVAFDSNSVPAVIAEPAGALVKQEIPAADPTQVTYRLSYTNTGTATAYDVRIRDVLPSPLGAVAGVVVSASRSIVCKLNVPLPANLVDVTCPRVPAGSNVTVTFTSGLPLCTTVTNRATLTYTSLPGPNGTVPNGTKAFPPGASGTLHGERVYSSSSAAVTSGGHCPDLTLIKFEGFSPSPGVVDYGINVINVGDVASVPPDTVVDTLPAGFIFLSGTGFGWTCSASGPTVTCTNTNPIPAGGFTSLTLEVAVPNGAPGRNCARVGTTVEADLDNNAGCECIFPLPIGMLAWYPFDEAPGGEFAFNRVADSPYGTYVAPPGAAGPQPSAGESYRSLCFDGKGSYVDVKVNPPTPVSVDLGSGDLTIDTWIKTAAGSGVQPLLDKSGAGAGGPAGYSFFLDHGRPGLRLTVAGAAASWTATTGNVADGHWHHVAVTVQRTLANLGTFYVDCQPAGSTFDPSGARGKLDNAGDLWIAASHSSPATTFAGCLDELEIFDRALSSAEIGAFCTARSSGKCKFDNN